MPLGPVGGEWISTWIVAATGGSSAPPPVRGPRDESNRECAAHGRRLVTRSRFTPSRLARLRQAQRPPWRSRRPPARRCETGRGGSPTDAAGAIRPSEDRHRTTVGESARSPPAARQLRLIARRPRQAIGLARAAGAGPSPAAGTPATPAPTVSDHVGAGAGIVSGCSMRARTDRRLGGGCDWAADIRGANSAMGSGAVPRLPRLASLRISLRPNRRRVRA